MLKTLTAGVGLVLAVAGFLVALAIAAPQRDTYKLTANLKARFEVPKPQSVPVGATGLFTGSAVERANDRAKVTWRLTFSNLSGRAMAAHIHAGRVGRAGGVMVALCGPCRSGQRGTTMISHAQLRAIRAGRTYVNVHTRRNAAGEIRGQVKAREGAGSGTDSTTTTTTETTQPPPYP
ncbi:MAG TPA: CHRD domain-containing protein [Gaiellaceae bacterium]|nr:CHRD domain-containing protein [Gaiellaceae bacterium]